MKASQGTATGLLKAAVHLAKIGDCLRTSMARRGLEIDGVLRVLAGFSNDRLYRLEHILTQGIRDELRDTLAALLAHVPPGPRIPRHQTAIASGRDRLKERCLESTE